jgi:foldase protein PrsA
LIALFIVAFNKPAASQQVVAKVNGEEIMKDDLYGMMSEEMGPQVLDQIIMEKLIQQEAKKQNISVSDEDLEAEIAMIKKSFPSEQEFDTALAMYGMTLDKLKEQMTTQVMINKIFESKVTISDEDVKKYFEENKDQFATPEKIQASHILVDTKEEADAILQELKGGADFAALAKEKSKDGSAANGGDLGEPFTRGKMVPEFEEAAFALNEGEISDVVQSQYGFHIIKLTKRIPGEPAKFEDKKEEIRKTLFTTEVSTQFQTWYEQIKAEAKIDNFML